LVTGSAQLSLIAAPMVRNVEQIFPGNAARIPRKLVVGSTVLMRDPSAVVIMCVRLDCSVMRKEEGRIVVRRVSCIVITLVSLPSARLK
jgi:hypothetical protein